MLNIKEALDGLDEVAARRLMQVIMAVVVGLSVGVVLGFRVIAPFIS